MAGQGDRIITEARKWLGTPYRHQGCRCQVGTDCLGLVRGVLEAVSGERLPEPGAYSADWAERGGEDRLLMAARQFCGEPVTLDAAMAGDLLLFRWRSGMAAKHLGFLSATDRFIHAYEGAGVIESPLVPGWRRRITAVFRWPGR